MTLPEFTARALGAMLWSAATDPGGRLCIDHADLPAAAWQRVAKHFGLEISPGSIRKTQHLGPFQSLTRRIDRLPRRCGRPLNASLSPAIARLRRMPGAAGWTGRHPIGREFLSGRSCDSY